jgi:hypothetical protein
MERSTIFKFGKPSFFMGHLYHGYVTNYQRVYPSKSHERSHEKSPLLTRKKGLKVAVVDSAAAYVFGNHGI